MGVGAVFRCAAGSLLGAVGQRIHQRLRPGTAELFALKIGLEFAVENRWDSFLVESDCMEVINQIAGNGECLSDDGVVVEEVKRLMGILHIPGILFVPRDANKAAHSVAYYVARNIGHFSWLGVGPSWFMQIINDEFPMTDSSSRNVCSGLASTAGHSNIVSSVR